MSGLELGACSSTQNQATGLFRSDLDLGCSYGSTGRSDFIDLAYTRDNRPALVVQKANTSLRAY